VAFLRLKYKIDIKRKQHRLRSDAHSMGMVERVQKAISDDPGQSIRKLAEELEKPKFFLTYLNSTPEVCIYRTE
jgi:hypothetical protein